MGSLGGPAPDSTAVDKSKSDASAVDKSKSDASTPAPRPSTSGPAPDSTAVDKSNSDAVDKSNSDASAPPQQGWTTPENWDTSSKDQPPPFVSSDGPPPLTFAALQSSSDMPSPADDAGLGNRRGVSFNNGIPQPEEDQARQSGKVVIVPRSSPPVIKSYDLSALEAVICRFEALAAAIKSHN